MDPTVRKRMFLAEHQEASSLATATTPYQTLFEQLGCIPETLSWHTVRPSRPRWLANAAPWRWSRDQRELEPAKPSIVSRQPMCASATTKIGAQIAADTGEPLPSKAKAVPRRRSNQC